MLVEKAARSGDDYDMIVLALNCGSSSVKFRVFDVDLNAAEKPKLLGKGLVERIGRDAVATVETSGDPPRRETPIVTDHGAAIRWVIERVRSSTPSLDAVGHRVVHGGEQYTRPVLIDPAVSTTIESLESLAPLHNGPNLAGIRACREVVGPDVPMVAVFDTAFHATLPESVYRYAIPYELSVRHGLRRFGFHGISYQFVVSRFCAIAGVSESAATLIAFHLGNGASVVAVKNGRSVDTSMGFTPLEGLVMGTRSGDLDPALIGQLAHRESVSVGEVERWLNERSGLAGISGGTRDMRDLLERSPTDARARLAVEMFCYRARKYLGAYLAALGGAQAVVFTGGIGEHSPDVRSKICEGMDWCGLALDPGLNGRASGSEGLISARDARIKAWVIPTNEELVIARETARLAAGAPH
jgi:acetate kinase